MHAFEEAKRLNKTNLWASRPVHFVRGERNPGTHWIGGWVATAGLEAVKKILFHTETRRPTPRGPSTKLVAIPNGLSRFRVYSVQYQYQMSPDSVNLLSICILADTTACSCSLCKEHRFFSGLPSRNVNMAICEREGEHKGKICGGHWPSGNPLIGIVVAVALYGHGAKEHSRAGCIWQTAGASSLYALRSPQATRSTHLYVQVKHNQRSCPSVAPYVSRLKVPDGYGTNFVLGPLHQKLLDVHVGWVIWAICSWNKTPSAFLKPAYHAKNLYVT
jgi:hypothetical protein